ncbi:MAG: MFS transporter, partial [Acinetobacter sp.]|nr:MFS transporter [Acinetobacter sp.]
LTLISLTGFAIAALFMGLSGHHIWLVMLGIVLWGMTFGGAPTLLQTALADVAGENVDIAQSMLVTVFNLAVAGGGIFGGILLQNVGIDSFFVCIIALSLLGLCIVFLASENGFKSGHRLNSK